MTYASAECRKRVATALVAGALVSPLVYAAGTVSAQSSGRVPIREKLRTPVDIHWKDVRLRSSLKRLARALDFALFIDRRVDSELRATLSIDRVPLSRALAESTAPHGLGYSTLGPTVYVGPADAAAALSRVGPKGRLPRDFRRKKPLAWPRFTSPRSLILDGMPGVADRLQNPEVIPHDLWAAGELPAMSHGEKLTLLLIGFDLTWELTDRGRTGSWRVVPVENVSPNAGVGRRMPDEAPAAKPKERRDQDLRFTLRVDSQPLRPVLQQIAARTGRTLDIEPSASDAADRRVSFGVREATLSDLVRAAAESAGLRAEVTPERITILPEK